MQVTKTTTSVYEVKFYPDSPIVFIWKEFKRAREANGMSTSKFNHCFCCGHKFSDEEKLIVISVKGKGNRFACAECLAKEGK